MKKRGFILIVALMVMSVIIIITSYLFDDGIAHGLFVRTAVQRQKAKQLALGGIQMAMSSMALVEQKDTKEKQSEEAQLLERLLPIINRAHKVVLTEGVDGIDGEIQFCIASEDGKLDLNQIYDFEKKKFYGEDQPQGDMKKFLQIVCAALERINGGSGLFESFVTYLSERGRPFNDPTELGVIKQFSVFKNRVWLDLETQGAEKRPVYLTDLFTVSTGKKNLEPWLLSDSWLAVLGIPRAGKDDRADRVSKVKEWVKNFKLQAAWATEWDTLLKPMYQKDFTTLPKGIDSFLKPRFESRHFSVVSCGKHGVTQQCLYAIIERQVIEREKRRVSSYSIKRVSWI